MTRDDHLAWQGYLRERHFYQLEQAELRALRYLPWITAGAVWGPRASKPTRRPLPHVAPV